jgi:nitric oxide synthase oxygenase domain/subunit
MMENKTLIRYAGMAKDLNSGDPINWENLEIIYNIKGKDHALWLINKEKDGANNIYLCHLSLAEKALNELS